MKSYYVTNDNITIVTNTPLPEWTEITKEEYDKLVTENEKQNEEFEQENIETVNRNNLIWQRALENAEKELIEEGTIEAKENKKEEVK